MWLRGYSLLHSAAQMLLNCVKLGCTIDCEAQWTKTELQAVEKEPHISALLSDAVAQLQAET